MTEYQFYQVEKKDKVAWVYLNRPEKKNAMNPAAWQEPVSIFEDLDRDDDVRVVVIAGKGPCFSAGIDLVEMMGELPEVISPDQKGGRKNGGCCRKSRNFRTQFPVLNGAENRSLPPFTAIASGRALIWPRPCDIRLCSADAQFCLKEAAVGFVADVGGIAADSFDCGPGPCQGTCVFRPDHYG